MLSADQVLLTLTAMTGTRVRNPGFDDGYWEAEALNSANQYVELRIRPPRRGGARKLER